jgi:hypothetical protein
MSSFEAPTTPSSLVPGFLTSLDPILCDDAIATSFIVTASAGHTPAYHAIVITAAVILRAGVFVLVRPQEPAADAHHAVHPDRVRRPPGQRTPQVHPCYPLTSQGLLCGHISRLLCATHTPTYPGDH